MESPDDRTVPTKPFDLKLDDLLHPAQAFDHPQDVVNDPDLTRSEKRAILASWVSDACAVEAAPALRCAPGGRRIVSVDEILESLRALDRQAGNTPASWARRQIRRADRSVPGELHGARGPRRPGFALRRCARQAQQIDKHRM